MIGWGALGRSGGAASLCSRSAAGATPPRAGSGRSAIVTIFMPLLANCFGWIFTEMARQPWVVYGLQLTANGVSSLTSPAEVWTSMIVLTLLYGGAGRRRGRAADEVRQGRTTGDHERGRRSGVRRP